MSAQDTQAEPTLKSLPDDVRVADATDLNWVDRFAPLRARPYLRLSRADRPAGTWLLLLPCWLGLFLAAAGDAEGLSLADLHIAVGCAVGAFLMRGAGCTWNDVADRNFDGEVARTRSRPIPSGAVSVRQALAWMVVQAVLAFAVLLTFPWAAIALGVISLAPVCIYPFMKRVTWWPQVFLGIAFNWGALLAWAAHAGSIGLAPVLLYLAGIAWTLFYDTIYACQDKDDDALIGVKSTARLFAGNTRRWLLGFEIAAVTLALLAVVLAMADGASGLGLALAAAGIWGFALRLHGQLSRFDAENPDLCLELFRDSRTAGLILAGAFLAAAVV
ncbi:MAG: 4-hydroxybenzoate octaprenyltransferase [Pseudomonadota bacterium]